MKISQEHFRRFDELLQQVLNDLPPELRSRFDEIPLVVEDYPSESMLNKLKLHRGENLCGVHSGIPLTRRSVRQSGTLPTIIMIYRQGILRASADKGGNISEKVLLRRIRVTILHELGHHFGLSEADLQGYGFG